MADGGLTLGNTQYLRNWKIDVFKSTVTLGPANQTQTISQPPEGGSAEVTITASEPQSLTEDLDLSQFRTTFEITAGDTETPNIAVIRIYNVGPETANKLIAGNVNASEFGSVRLQAGYGNQLGTIFQGQIKQAFVGRENPTDTFVILHAADGDEMYNFSVIAQSVAAGATDKDMINNLMLNATSQQSVTWDQSVNGSLGGVLPTPRGTVMWGMARVHLRMIADHNNCTWKIQNGKVVFTPKSSPGVGAPIVLSSQTGMLGIPVQSADGIIIKCLINPVIQVGSRVQISNKDILRGLFSINRQNQPDPTSTNFLANVTDRWDGFYRVFVIDYKGDSRGNEWTQTLTCLAVDPSSNTPQDYVPPPTGGFG